MIIGGYDSTNSIPTGKILELRAGGSGIIDWQEVDAELENARYNHVVIPVPEQITTCQQFTTNCETLVEFVSWVIFEYQGPTQVKCRLLISSIFDAMNFQHFLKMLEFKLQHFQKMLEIHCIKNPRN